MPAISIVEPEVMVAIDMPDIVEDMSMVLVIDAGNGTVDIVVVYVCCVVFELQRWDELILKLSSNSVV